MQRHRLAGPEVQRLDKESILKDAYASERESRVDIDDKLEL